MFDPNVVPLIITYLLLPQAFVHGGLVSELFRQFGLFFKPSKSTQQESCHQVNHRESAPYYDHCNLCTFGPCTPMVRQPTDVYFAGFVQAKSIKTALESLTDEEKVTIANILMERSALQRVAIADAFTTHNPLTNTISEELYQKLSTAKKTWRYYLFIKFMSLPLSEFYGNRFRDALFLQHKNNVKQNQGQATIVELLTTLPKCLLDGTIAYYNSHYEPDLIPALETHLAKANKSPEYREVLKKLVKQNRDTNHCVSSIKALTFAYKLKSDVISQRESNMKERFSKLFIELSIPQAIETIIVYENLRRGDKEFKSLFDDIDRYKGGEKEIYKTMVRLFKNKPLYFAEEIESILKSGVRDDTYEERLIYLFVGRYDTDLKDIIVAYNHKSKTGLRADFETWDTDISAAAFHPIMLDIIDKASRMH